MDELGFLTVPNCPSCLVRMTDTVGAWFCGHCGFVQLPEDIEEDEIDPDDYRIPDGVFGDVPEALPKLIGKVVMLAALLETKIEALASAVDNRPQSYFGGRGPAANSETIVDRLRKYQETPDEADLSARILVLLDDARAALEERNFIVHGVWPSTERDSWWAWKPIRQKRGIDSVRSIDDKTWTAREFVELCRALNSLVGRSADLIGYVGGVPRRP